MNKYLQQVQDPNVVTLFKVLMDELTEVSLELRTMRDRYSELYNLSEKIDYDLAKIEKEVHDIRSTEYYD